MLTSADPEAGFQALSDSAQSGPALDGEKEQELLRLAQSGDRHAYGLLVEAYRERCFAAAYGLTGNEEDARDLSQDAFVKAYQALTRFQQGRPFYPWLYRILHNACLNFKKRHVNSRSTSLNRLTDEEHVQFEARVEDPVERIQAQQMAGHLRDAIAKLKPEFREILIMKHFQEMTYDEMAEALDIPVGTVMSRLFHARKALASLMEPFRVRS